ncbi:hypothetical protein BP6252_06032 [Coleophoma cylindrospora]|uniref:Zn(2)-C6 fungal-type domain-containing protein n=1 Tax=Coleophoma cylindrospora TaxID=1849047 RepID=A0A3D8RLR0_9HELO|nr:hypothetical protein BP6252_06032 [Coleophoma cylindrospora]
MAKRRCGKQTPHCLRCRTRGIECSYPPPKPTRFVLCRDDDTPPVVPDVTPPINWQMCTYSPGLQVSTAENARPGFVLDLPGLSSRPVDEQLASSWFSSLETWEIIRPTADQKLLTVYEMKAYLRKIHRWLSDWVEKGSNPFIHARLYGNRFPRCIQDAYASLSCYLHKTPANEQAVFHIIEDRAKQLLADNGIHSPGSPEESKNRRLGPIDPLEHVARVQALLVYQTVGLYDGNIRLRSLSESYIPVLEGWMIEMVQHAKNTVCLGDSVVSPIIEQTDVGPSRLFSALDEDLLWYSWIAAESMRRTWVIGSSIQVMFMALHQGGIPPCQGGMMFTTRQGVWEAQSAVAWEKLCSEVHVGLMQMADTHRIFTEAAPEDINDFTKVILEVIYGTERIKRWGVQIDFSDQPCLEF